MKTEKERHRWWSKVKMKNEWKRFLSKSSSLIITVSFFFLSYDPVAIWELGYCGSFLNSWCYLFTIIRNIQVQIVKTLSKSLPIHFIRHFWEWNNTKISNRLCSIKTKVCGFSSSGAKSSSLRQNMKTTARLPSILKMKLALNWHRYLMLNFCSNLYFEFKCSVPCDWAILTTDATFWSTH